MECFREYCEILVRDLRKKFDIGRQSANRGRRLSSRNGREPKRFGRLRNCAIVHPSDHVIDRVPSSETARVLSIRRKRKTASFWVLLASTPRIKLLWRHPADR